MTRNAETTHRHGEDMIFETFLIIPWLVNFNHPGLAHVTLDFIRLRPPTL